MLKNRAAIKSVAIYLRMTAKDKAAIEERAKERKMTVTEYLTRTGLARLTRQRADVDAIHQLRLCVEELKGITQSEAFSEQYGWGALTRYITQENILDGLGGSIEKAIAVEIGQLSSLA